MGKRSVQLTAIALVGFATACGYDNEDGPVVQPSSDIAVANIDTDATMSNIVAGAGVGMFVEYATGGAWKLQFTCDTNDANLSCPWTVQAQTLDTSEISGISDSKISQSSSYLITYETVTTKADVDSFTFQTSAGTPVGFDVWLKYEDYPHRYVFWIGDGALNSGITSPSFDLYPTPAR